MKKSKVAVASGYIRHWLCVAVLLLLAVSSAGYSKSSLFTYEPEAGTWMHYGDTWVLLRDFDPAHSMMTMATTSVISLLPVGFYQALSYVNPTINLSAMPFAGLAGNMVGFLYYYLRHSGFYIKLPNNHSPWLKSSSHFLAPVHVVGNELSSRIRLSLYRYGADWPMLDISYLPGGKSAAISDDHVGQTGLSQVARFMELTGTARVQLRLSAHKQYVHLLISTLAEKAREWKNFSLYLPGQQLWNVTDIPQLAAWMLTPGVLRAVTFAALPVYQGGTEAGEIVFRSSFFTVMQGETLGDFIVEPRSQYAITSPDLYGGHMKTFHKSGQQVWLTDQCSLGDDPICTGLLTHKGASVDWLLGEGKPADSELYYVNGPVRISELDSIFSSRAGQSPYYEIPSWFIHAALIPAQVGMNILFYKVFTRIGSMLRENIASLTDNLEQGPADIYENTDVTAPVSSSLQLAEEERQLIAEKLEREGLAGVTPDEWNQRQKLLRKYGFRTIKIDMTADSNSRMCSICLDDYVKDDHFLKPISKLDCSHIFHQECINGYCGRYSKRDCPICREEFQKYSGISGLPQP